MSDNVDKTGDSLNEVVEMLSHEYRRRILMAVARQNPQDDDDILSDEVADATEEDADALELLTQQLQQIHFPKLDEAGFIDWDRDEGTITRGPRFKEIEPLLRLMHDHQDELLDDWP